MRSIFFVVVATLTLSATASASAQMYKWVDSKGVTNYSNQPPGGDKSAAAVHPVPMLVTTYTPDPVLEREVHTFRENAAMAAENAGALTPREAKLRAQRIAAAAAAKAAQAEYEKCTESRQVDCNQTESGNDGGWPVGIAIEHFWRGAYAGSPEFASRAFAGGGPHGAGSYGSRRAPPRMAGPLEGVSIR